ncbi:HNH endonuclease [Pseudomonas fulva]|uniref:HNH endonuclease n=1 Tax=Pseudomonas fulva TaxID=47880 RepID=UPI0034617B91
MKIRADYNTALIVQELERIFHGKCYLCEQAQLSDPEIEHFKPHLNDKALKNDWNNLYYSCSRCNSIKGATHVDLLDCCNPNVDVFKSIKIVLPTIPDDDIIVTPSNHLNKNEVNTASLVSLCYNDRKTGLRGITRSSLMEKLQAEYLHIAILTHTILNKKSTPTKITEAKESIEVMLQDDYPFSAVWKWYVLGHSALQRRAPELTQSL